MTDVPPHMTADDWMNVVGGLLLTFWVYLHLRRVDNIEREIGLFKVLQDDDRKRRRLLESEVADLRAQRRAAEAAKRVLAEDLRKIDEEAKR